jgi:hypothetical protein
MAAIWRPSLVEPYAEALHPIVLHVYDRSFQGSDPETRMPERTGEYRDGICNPVLDASRLPEREQRGTDGLFRCGDDDSSSLALGSDHIQALTGAIAGGSIGRAGEPSTLIVQGPTCGSRVATDPWPSGPPDSRLHESQGSGREAARG